MNKKIALLSFVLVCFSASSVFGVGISPVVDIGPGGSQAAKLEVGSTVGDGSWMFIEFSDPILINDHPVVTVSFDIYRDWAVDGLQQLVWGWVTSDDQWVYPDLNPSWGVQEVYGPYQTYPFGFYEYSDYHANTVFNDYANITLEWNFETGYASAWYDGSAILLSTPFTTSIEYLYGWDISLNNCYDDGSDPGADIVWIDNFSVTGSNIYNSYGFDNFTVGSLSGQDGWLAGNENGTAPVPEPSTMLLLGSGMVGIIGVTRRRLKK